MPDTRKRNMVTALADLEHGYLALWEDLHLPETGWTFGRLLLAPAYAAFFLRPR